MTLVFIKSLTITDIAALRPPADFRKPLGQPRLRTIELNQRRSSDHTLNLEPHGLGEGKR